MSFAKIRLAALAALCFAAAGCAFGRFQKLSPAGLLPPEAAFISSRPSAKQRGQRPALSKEPSPSSRPKAKAGLQTGVRGQLPRVKLRFLNEQVLEGGKTFRGLKAGGLSALAFDPLSKEILALSDDKKNHRICRFALARLPSPEGRTGSRRYSLRLKGDIRLLPPKNAKPGFKMDPEGLALAEGGFFIASEGQQIFYPPQPPQILFFSAQKSDRQKPSRQARLKRAWPVPPVFWDPKRLRRFGARENKGFESLSIDKKSQTLWTASEKPLRQDVLNSRGGYVRITGFALPRPAGKGKGKNGGRNIRHGQKEGGGKMLVQYGYPLQSRGSGLSEALNLGSKVFLTLERAYKKEKDKKQGVNEVNLFLADCRAASDVSGLMALKKPFRPCSKSLLWASKRQRLVRADNLEGMTIIPFPEPAPQEPPAGGSGGSGGERRLLILVSDNNFNERAQKTQFLFFEMELKWGGSF